MEEGQRESLGAVVKTLREAQGLSREELVVRTHDDPEQRISLEMLAKVEQGRRAPSAKTLRKLAHALGLEPTTLVSSAALWEAGSADGTHVAALRSHVLGNASVGASLGTLGAGLGRFSQPTKYGVAAIAGGLVGMPVAAAGVAAVGGLRELQRRKEVIDAMRARLAELEESATDEQLAEASRALNAVVESDDDRT